jgi:DNA-directed RNA polymerase subunit RPC12/RpoP
MGAYPHSVIIKALTQQSTPKEVRMELNLDDASLALPCPKCGHEIQETVGRLKNDPDITCPACSTVISIDSTQLRGGLEQAQESLNELDRTFRDAFK